MKNILNLLCNGKVKDFHGTIDANKDRLFLRVYYVRCTVGSLFSVIYDKLFLWIRVLGVLPS